MIENIIFPFRRYTFIAREKEKCDFHLKEDLLCFFAQLEGCGTFRQHRLLTVFSSPGALRAQLKPQSRLISFSILLLPCWCGA